MANLNIDSGEAVATLRDVTVTYNGYQTRALARVNLEVRPGEVLGVLGAKGAGKSTLMKIIAGRLAPTEGKARVFGRSPRGRIAKARIGYLPGNVDAARPQGFFEKFLGGKKESVSSARGIGRLTSAMVGGRDLLVLDDAFDGLSGAEVVEVVKLIRELVARGKTVVVSSDSLMAVKELCGRFAVLHEGRMQAVGTLSELLSGEGAVQFLPAVLPSEMVGRVLKVLREEIGAGVILTETKSAEKKVDAQPGPQSVLKKVPEAESKTGDSIDHQKLHELTKPMKAD